MISARYETLKKQKVFPENLEPKPMNQTRVAQWKKSDQLAEEWVTWLSEPEVSQAPDRGPFWFEAQRMLYERSAILSSTDELEKLALKDPDAEYAIASASLVLDTWVVSQEWTKVISTAQEFQSVAAWKKLPFYSKTLALVATAELKQIEIGLKERKPDETLALVQKWVKKHPESELKGSALWIAFETAYVHEQWDRSLELSSQILSETEKKLTDEQRWTLHARRGILFEKRLDFVEAIHAWTKQDSLKKDPALRIKMLTWAVVFEDSKLIQSVRETACESKSTKPASDPLCAQAQVWQSYLEAYSPGHTIDKAAAKKALELAKDGPEHSRAIWSSIAFAQLEGFNYRDRMSAVRQFVLHLEKLPEALQISLIRQAGPKVVRAFELNRTQMDTIAPLRANPNYIVARMEIIKSMETVATHAMKLPWRALHAGVLREIAALYVDVGSGIRRVSGKKSDQALDEQIAQLIMPLEEKGQDLLAKAFEIASNSLLTSAEIDRVAEPYFASNPSTASKLKQSRAPAQTLIWGWDRWQRRKNDWTPSEKLFSQAIQQSRFALGFTLLKLLPEANQAEARIALLQKLGAQSEALSFLEHHLGALGQPSDSEPRRWAREHWSELASIASQSYAFKKAEDYRAEIAKFEATAAPAAPTTPVTATPMQPQALQRSPSSKAGKSQTKN
jgi:hypothetical protein